MEKIYLTAVSTINYLFLRMVEGKEPSRIIKDELNNFFNELSNMGNQVPDDIISIIKNELNEGDYIERLGYPQFLLSLSETIKDIMSYQDENVYALYKKLAEELSGETIEKKVMLLQDDTEFINGIRRVGVAVFIYDGSFSIEDDEALIDYIQDNECVLRVYGETEAAAYSNARAECRNKHYKIVGELDFQDIHTKKH